MPTSIQEASRSLARSTRQLFWLPVAGSALLIAVAVGVLLLASRESETLRNLPVGVAIALLLVAGLLLSRHVYRRMRAEAAANFAYELLRETMDNVTQGVAVFNTQHQLIAWNARFAELRALDPTQLRVGKPLAEILREGRSMTHVHEGAAGITITAPPIGSLTPFDVEARQADGTMLVMRGRPLHSSNYIITYTDVTALKRSESAYRDQATRLTATLDNVVDAIVTINESGSIESWSKGAERLFGYAAHEVLRRNVRILMPEPQDLVHSVAEQWFGTLAPRLDAAAFVDGHDGVNDVIECRRTGASPDRDRHFASV